MVYVKEEQTYLSNSIAERLDLLTVDEVYESVLTEAGHNLGLDVDIQLGGLLTTYTVPETQDVIRYYACDMVFNTALSSYIAKDKVLCSELLREAGVACIEHTEFKVEDFITILDAHNFPLVMKPSRGLGGTDVHFIYNASDLLKAYKEIESEAISISPYVGFSIEYRVTVLDEEVLMTYGKTKGENNQNNLSKGAKVVETPKHLLLQLRDLALRAAKALNLRSANIDIVFLDGTTPLVLEVNNTVALKRVAKASREFYYASIDAYTEMLQQSLYDIGKSKNTN